MRIRLTLAACLTVIPALGHQASHPPLPAEPADRSPIGGPGWSPWITTEDGEIQWNPSTAYNAWVASLPPHQCAWTVLSTLETERPGRSTPPLGIHFVPTPPSINREAPETEEPPATTWEEMRAALETPEGRALVATLREALDRPYLGEPLRFLPGEDTDPANPALLVANVSAPASLRRFAPLLCAEASRLLENDDPRGFVEMVTRVHQSGRLVGSHPMGIVLLIKVDLEFIAHDTAAWGIKTYPDRFDDSLILQLDKLLQSPVELESGVIRLDGQDSARRMFHPDRLHDQSPMGSPLHGSVESLPHAARSVIAGYESLIDAAQTLADSPWNPATQDRDTWIKQVFATIPGELKPGPVESLMIDVEAHATYEFAWFVRHRRLTATGLRVALAAHRHRLRHGEFPESIAAFDPDLLPFQPSDAYSGGTLIYRLDGGTSLIYSVGPDRDDDQGRNDPYAARSSGVDWDGDFVIFPPL